MSTAVIGLCSDIPQAEMVVNGLKSSGFINNDISILMPDANNYRTAGFEKHSKAPEGISTGAGTGAVLGGAFGWLVGAGMLAVPGLGPAIAAGPVMAALSGAAVGGAIGGVSGGLVGMGIPEIEAKQYEGRVIDGGKILIAVHTDNGEQVKVAENIFKNAKANEINCVTEEKVEQRS